MASKGYKPANRPYTHPGEDAQLLVLACLSDGARSWDELQAATELDEDLLGDVISELLTQNKVRTGQQDDVRVYWLVDTRA
jgi:hypothetical protein